MWEFYILTSSCPTFFATLGAVSLFNFSLLNERIVVSCCDLNLHFPDENVEHLLMCFSVIGISTFIKCLKLLPT